MSGNLKILLTNDDGFYAEGLQTLYACLKEDPALEVTIVAPDLERSAVGHGITMHQPLRVFEVFLDGCSHWMLDGTPSDCVKLAAEQLLKNDPPGLIISGINRGSNLGNDILYSGTVSAAIEGAIYKIPSLAASVAGYGKIDFKPAAGYIRDKIFSLKDAAGGTALNLNFPTVADLSGYKGVKFTRLGTRIYQNVFEERRDPRGQSYYWIGGEPLDFEQAANSDIKALADGYISITPLHYDLTDYHFLENNSAQFKNLAP